MKSMRKILFSMIMIFILIFLGSFTTQVEANSNSEKDYVYLSDIKYIANQSSVAWGSITLDQNLETKYNDGLITLNINGQKTQFFKGISAHANSTLVYDLTNYDYDYFTAYIGVDESRGNNGNGVKFYIYTSNDGTNWNLKTEERPQVLKGNSNAVFVKVDIKTAKYLKLYCNNNGNESSDHSVYANAKLIKEGHTEPEIKPVDFIKTLEEYDEILKNYEGQEIKGDYELTLLQREFVKNVKYNILQVIANASEEYKETLSWLMNDVTNLRLYIHGGKPDGSYIASIKVLNELYQNYKEDFKIKEVTKHGTVLGDLYKKMAITLSLTHSQRVALWMQPSAAENQSDAVTRYAIYKKMHADGKFKATNTVDITPWFEDYKVEEMRWVLGTMIDDEEILWLNEYTQAQINKNPNSVWGLLTPHPYMAYVYPNYGNPIFYSDENKDYFNELFSVPQADGTTKKLWDYGITRGNINYRLFKLWMNFRNKFGTGAVCGGISKSGHCIRGVHGIASAVIGQPGHAALLYYTRNSSGQGYWGIDNDVSGWNYSEKGERLPLGWGNDKTYVRGYNVPYVILAQEALNDYENFEKAEKILMKVDLYKEDKAKQEQIYREAIEAQSINLDAWAGLAKLYMSDTTKTEEDYYNLEAEMMEALKYFPFPMYNLSNYIKTKITSVEYSFKFTLLQTRILNEAKNYQGTAVLQPGLTRNFATHLLGQIDTSLAKFSFDGTDAGKIVLSNRFDGNGVRWDYSIDGKQTWNEISFTAQEEHKLQLTTEELNSITSEKDIYIHIVGTNYSEENLYKIDILESAGLPSTLYANDLENKLIAAVPSMQWKYREEDEWTSYKDAVPDLTGDKSVIVRMGRTGTHLESKTNTTYQFTTNADTNARKYIPIEHLSIHGVSTQATSNGGAAVNSIDGNMNTRYHSAWNGTDTQRYIIMKIDRPVYLSAVEFVPADGGNGKIVDGTIWGSMDGENWEVLARQKNLTYNPSNISNNQQAANNIKSFEIESLRKVQYVKIVADKTNGNWFTARMFNFYESTEVSATFSFDGSNAGKIVLTEAFENVNWEYCIDGVNWKAANGISYQLSKEELEQINENDKIKIRFEGNDKEHTINIKKEEVLSQNVYINDWENRLIGITNIDRLEWKLANSDSWISYQEQEPVVKGDNTLLVRTKATGIYTASDSTEYQFTTDTNTETAKYIPISHLSIHNFSTQSIDSNRPFYAPNAIDGNRNTLWHTDFRYSIEGQRAYITIKLDSAKYISAMEFVQKKYRADDPCLIQNMIVSVSEDGENWKEIGRKENCEQNEEFKRIDFAESMPAQYVKLEMEAYQIFASLAMVNLYEDTTKTQKPGEIEKPDEPDEMPISSSKYEIEENFILRISPGTTLNQLKQNIKAEQEYIVENQAGETLEENDMIATGMILRIDGKEFKLVVTGDINQDGRISLTDVALMKLHLVGTEVLTGAKLKAADINSNGNITVTDLAQIQMILVE